MAGKKKLYRLRHASTSRDDGCTEFAVTGGGRKSQLLHRTITPPTSGALTCAAVWELTAYTNGYMANTNHFSGELHRPILQLGISYGLSSLTELPPPPRYMFAARRLP